MKASKLLSGAAALAIAGAAAAGPVPIRTFLAELGHVPSEVWLARHYDEATPRQPVRAAYYWAMAAQRYDLGAIRRAATICWRGDGVRADRKLALGWLRRAAGMGDVEAKRLVAAIYLAGEGVPRDLPEARRWFEEAGEAGDVGAMLEAGRLWQGAEGHPADGRAARRWYVRAAEAGSPVAAFRLGVMHEEGLGVGAEPVAALMWYGAAAARGHTLAKEGLAFLETRVGPQEKAAGREWLAAWRLAHLRFFAGPDTQMGLDQAQASRSSKTSLAK